MKRTPSHQPSAISYQTDKPRLKKSLTSYVLGFGSWISGLSIFLAACGGTELRPVDIAAEDMCAFCKMAISEKQYAAEFITKDGEPLKFDDLSCMIRYIEGKQNQDAIAAYFVVDFTSRAWVKAEEAHYVRSSEFKTPMRGGIVAFKDVSKANEAAVKYRGELLRFANVMNVPQRREGTKNRYENS